jgi:hypothetical protein
MHLFSSTLDPAVFPAFLRPARSFLKSNPAGGEARRASWPSFQDGELTSFYNSASKPHLQGD